MDVQDAHSTRVWQRAGRHLELLGLRAETAEVAYDGSLVWSGDAGDPVLPAELPSRLGRLTAESTATATGVGGLQVVNAYVMASGERLVVLVQNDEFERGVHAWLVEDAHWANLVIHDCVEDWLKAGWKAAATYADWPGGEADAAAAFRVLVDPETGEGFYAELDGISPLHPAGGEDELDDAA